MASISSLVDSVDSLENFVFNYKDWKGDHQKKLNYNDIKFWKKCIKKKLLRPYYPNLKLENLEMIVIGSSGVKKFFCKFNEALAMVKEPKSYGTVPSTVRNLIRNLHTTFNPNEPLKVPKHQKRSLGFDLSCLQLKDRVLFINVCLSPSTNMFVNTVCSIHFINELMKAKEKTGKKLVVMDFRLSKHSSNENRLKDASWELGKYSQTNPAFEIENPSSFHHYFQLCHPGYIKALNNEKISKVYVEVFKQIDEMGYPIKKMYMPFGKSFGY